MNGHGIRTKFAMNAYKGDAGKSCINWKQPFDPLNIMNFA